MKSPNLQNLIISVLLSIIILLPSKSFSANIDKDSLINSANAERANRNISTLSENELLDSAALQKAQNMFANNYFDHYSPTGVSPWDFILANGYDYTFAGENLAMDFATSSGVQKAWMASPTHAKNILNPDFDEIGIAVVEGTINNNQTTLVVQMFGSKTDPDVLGIFDSKLIQTINQFLGI